MDDITDTLAPKSDQLDGIDLAATGPRIFTVESVDVRKGSEQPVVIHLAEFDRPWKPAVTMRRVLATCWGTKSSAWAGRRAELYYEPNVTYGKDKPGGTRIKRLSHIDGPIDVDVMLSQGRMGKYHVQPLTEPAPTPTRHVPTPAEVAACTDLATLQGWRDESNARLTAAVDARIKALFDQDEAVPDDAA